MSENEKSEHETHITIIVNGQEKTFASKTVTYEQDRAARLPGANR